MVRIERAGSDTTPTVEPAPAHTVVESAGVPVRIVAEAINLDGPVVEMGWDAEQRGEQRFSVWHVPDTEAGWHSNSAHPGTESNVVISGHNNSLGGRIFADLENLQPGDTVTLWTDRDESFTYQIAETRLVRALLPSEETMAYLYEVMQPTPHEQLTLITCWPSWSNTHRLVLIATPVTIP